MTVREASLLQSIWQTNLRRSCTFVAYVDSASVPLGQIRRGTYQGTKLDALRGLEPEGHVRSKGRRTLTPSPSPLIDDTGHYCPMIGWWATSKGRDTRRTGRD
jgi:hypothetical protein